MFESPLPVGCFWLLGQGTVDAVRYEAAAYASLSETARETVPPFAENIYMAEFADWQVGEWIWRFDVPADSEAELRQWYGDGEVLPEQAVHPRHVTIPVWWDKSADARVLSSGQDVAYSSCVWYSALLNRVWVLYSKR